MDDFGNVGIKEFEFSPEPKRFRLYKGESEFVFHAAPALPIGMLPSMVNMAKMNVREAQLEVLLEFFDAVLIDNSVAKMREYAESKTRPLGVEHITPIITWLLEAYGLRPQVPSLPSSPGSAGDDSTSSTDGVQAEE